MFYKKAREMSKRECPGVYVERNVRFLENQGQLQIVESDIVWRDFGMFVSRQWTEKNVMNELLNVQVTRS